MYTTNLLVLDLGQDKSHHTEIFLWCYNYIRICSENDFVSIFFYFFFKKRIFIFFIQFEKRRRFFFPCVIPQKCWLLYSSRCVLNKYAFVFWCSVKINIDQARVTYKNIYIIYTDIIDVLHVYTFLANIVRVYDVVISVKICGFYCLFIFEFLTSFCINVRCFCLPVEICVVVVG